MSGRILPWVALAAVIAVILTYLYTRPVEVVVVAPPEHSQRSGEAPAPVSSSTEPAELSPPEATAHDAAAALDQLKRDQERETMEKPPEPATMDNDMKTPPGESTEKKP